MERQTRRVQVLQGHLLQSVPQQEERPTELLCAQDTNGQATTPSDNDTHWYEREAKEQCRHIVARYHAKSGCLQISLKRVKALNALTFDMIRTMTALLRRAIDDPRISFVLMNSLCERAFCAGGDIKDLLSPDAAYSASFFDWEFNLNRLIHRFSKPVVCLLNGITMGGGVGISVYASHRVARAADFAFAMPETGIGFFTDVGAGWFLSKLPTSRGMGMYVALTGIRLNAWDAAYNGIVTHVVQEDQEFEQLAQHLVALDVPHGSSVTQLKHMLDRELAEFVPPFDQLMQRAKVAQNHTIVDYIFEMESVDAMVDTLTGLSSPDTPLPDVGHLDRTTVRQWSQKTLKILRTKCPMSLKVTMESLKRGSTLGEQLESVLERDFRIGVRLTREHNFREGVRAVLVEKDKNPKWQPARLADINNADVQRYFEPLSKEIQFPISYHTCN